MKNITTWVEIKIAVPPPPHKYYNALKYWFSYEFRYSKRYKNKMKLDVTGKSQQTELFAQTERFFSDKFDQYFLSLNS